MKLKIPLTGFRVNVSLTTLLHLYGTQVGNVPSTMPKPPLTFPVGELVPVRVEWTQIPAVHHET